MLWPWSPFSFARAGSEKGDHNMVAGPAAAKRSVVARLNGACRLITYWPARSIFIPGAEIRGEEIRDAHRPSKRRTLPSAHDPSRAASSMLPM